MQYDAGGHRGLWSGAPSRDLPKHIQDHPSQREQHHRRRFTSRALHTPEPAHRSDGAFGFLCSHEDQSGRCLLRRSRRTGNDVACRRQTLNSSRRPAIRREIPRLALGLRSQFRGRRRLARESKRGARERKKAKGRGWCTCSDPCRLRWIYWLALGDRSFGRCSGGYLVFRPARACALSLVCDTRG